jgi:hypothetical protein
MCLIPLASQRFSDHFEHPNSAAMAFCRLFPLLFIRNARNKSPSQIIFTAPLDNAGKLRYKLRQQPTEDGIRRQ